jgi:molybdopterin molybdotransferase
MVGDPKAGQRIGRLTPLAEALAAVEAITRPVERREADIGAALGRVLAADINASTPLPPADIALRDGFAVPSAQTTDASSYTPALLSAPPKRVDAGQPMPAGMDAVAALDTVVMRGATAEIVAAVAPGEGVLLTGADVQPGLALRLAGERLRGIDQALLAAAGVTKVAIREPRIRLVGARGSDAAIAHGYEWLAQTLIAAGAAVIPDADDSVAPDYLEAAFHHEASDAILVLGGTGEAMMDQSVTMLTKAGRVAFHGIGLMPGETTAFGSVAARSVLLLPARLDAALAAWLAVGRHWLRALSGQRDDDKSVIAQLARKVTSTVGMAEVVAVRCNGANAEPLASGYLSLAALSRADGWILVPPESEGYPAGAQVAVRPLP